MFDLFLWWGTSLKSCLGSSVETQQLSVLVQVSASRITSFLSAPGGVNRVLMNAVQRVECLGKQCTCKVSAVAADTNLAAASPDKVYMHSTVHSNWIKRMLVQSKPPLHKGSLSSYKLMLQAGTRVFLAGTGHQSFRQVKHKFVTAFLLSESSGVSLWEDGRHHSQHKSGFSSLLGDS